MGLQDVLNRIKIAAFAFLAVFLFGICGFWLIDPAGSLFDAFYMTAMVITTIGFHEVIDLSHSPAGRVFTVCLAFGGIGILTYLLSNLSALFIEGDIRKTFYKKSMISKIDKLDGHYIICGCGRVGKNIAEELYRTKRSFVMTDTSEEVLEDFLENMPNSIFLSGDSTDDSFLESLGIHRAVGLFATASDDNTNLVICLTARQMNPSLKIIARLNDISRAKKMKQAGADKVISPNFIGGLQMASEMIRPVAASFMEDMMRSNNMNLRLEEIRISSKKQGTTVGDISLSGCENTIILALKDEKKWNYNPPKSTPLMEGNFLIAMTTPEERKILENRLN
jgi:voltage-gated potassium channel